MRNREGRKDSISKPHPGSSGTLEIVIPKIDIVASPNIIEVIEATATNQLQAGHSSQEITLSSEPPIDRFLSFFETRTEPKEELQELSAQSDSKENRTNESESDRKRGRDDKKHPTSEPPPKRRRKSELPPNRSKKDDWFNQSFINFYNSPEGQASLAAFRQIRHSSIEAFRQSRHLSEDDAKTDVDTATEERNRQSPIPGQNMRKT